ncbi:hypothetical protein IU483_14280 [Streptomyces gardneri]|nr:hypothetical protein [Streptomyces gardneri]
MNSDIDVFLSYARKADEDIAPALQQGLETPGQTMEQRPAGIPRPYRAFRPHDLTSFRRPRESCSRHRNGRQSRYIAT